MLDHIRIAITLGNIHFSKITSILCVLATRIPPNININSIINCVAAPHARPRFWINGTPTEVHKTTPKRLIRRRKFCFSTETKR